jgi:two-component system phosphate regulon sensor histidine kinase PhoR
MSWLFPRLVAGLLCVVGGSVLGYLVRGGDGALMGALLAGLLGFASIVARDAMQGWRLLRWLRDPRQASAPPETGSWGELGYRIEKNLRSMEREAQIGRDRLEQFLLAMEASPNGVLLLDGADHIEWCNARAADHFGLDPVRDRRQPVTNLVRSPAFVSHLQSREFERPVTFHEPRVKGSLQVTIRLYGTDSKLVISQDMTERERADAMRRDFVANVSHEIRTPLTVLSGFLETMRNLRLSEPEQKKVIALMTQQAERMGNLVGDLLTLARLEGSPRPAADEWVLLSEMLGKVEAEARALSAGRHALSFPQAGDARIAGSESELRSAVANLVNNAVRYTPEGGSIDVRWHIAGNGAGELMVTDSGRGIAREHLPRLTERFYRVDGSRSRESGGTGLGLAIVKHVIQRHGGELGIESEPGRGSTFRLTLPAARVNGGAGVATHGASAALTQTASL